jgi:RNase_H superfamily
MPKYLAFDLEIAKIISGSFDQWRSNRPLGIACAATLSSDDQPRLWYGQNPSGDFADQMSESDALELVAYLEEAEQAGYTILTWNGLGFDFDILAEESRARQRCRRLASRHVDMMFHVFCLLGHPLSLDAAAKGMGLTGKLAGMSAEQAPINWAAGKHQQVLDYLIQDVRTTLDLAAQVEQRHQLTWITRRGSLSRANLPNGWLNVEQALQLPEPNDAWTSNKWSRSRFTAWLDIDAQQLHF